MPSIGFTLVDTNPISSLKCQDQHIYKQTQYSITDSSVMWGMDLVAYVMVFHVSLSSLTYPLVYEAGAVFLPSVLDISDEDLLKHFTEVCQ